MRSCLFAVSITCGLCSARAQWTIQESHTTASFRGIHAVSASVAWASGTGGTVLHTEDGGSVWQTCAIPPGAEKLDFRGVWAWDAKNALVMSAGPGELSRVYRTTDGCAHWTEELRSKDKDGFWDAMVFQTRDFGLLGELKAGVLIGDPVSGHFDTKVTTLAPGWSDDDAPCAAHAGEGAFAASNSSVFVFGLRRYILGTGVKGGPRILLSPLLAKTKECREVTVPLASGTDSAGVFSVYFKDWKHGIAVGGDYKKPGESSGTAAWTADGGLHWIAATKPPHGFRSAVVWYPEAKAWIAAGTNGSDISRDNGKTWQSLDDGNWNALSTPYVVGPKGRIGRIQPESLKR